LGAHGSDPGGADDLRGRASLTETTPTDERVTDDVEARLAALDAVVAALAHPARRQILLTIHLRGDATAGDIAGRFAHKWPTTTRHLRVLEEAGLVRHERRGRTRVYTVDRTRLALVTEWLRWFEMPAPATEAR
jgi:DNA-binding transcriptional ArsR family regulator